MALEPALRPVKRGSRRMVACYSLGPFHRHMARIYIAATEQHAGKTTMSVGIYRAAVACGYRACFIKPVGQRYVLEGDQKVDEDAVLFKRALGVPGAVGMLSPVTIPRGYTNEYIHRRDPESVHTRIVEAVNGLDEEKDIVIVEGTGHAGVGSVLDASNAEVAALLDAQVVIVSGGGIGRCIDELCLNQALFQHHGVPVIGAIINKVYEEKYDKVSEAVRMGLAQHGMDCLGVVPYRPELTYRTMRHLRDELGMKVQCGEEHIENKVQSIIVAAMAPQNMVNYLKDGTLVIVPGDRVDNIIATLNAQLMNQKGSAPQIAGMVLTGGLVPDDSIRAIMDRVDVPVLLSEEDTAAAAFEVRRLVPKITPQDVDKIQAAEDVVRSYVDTAKIFRAVGLTKPNGE